MRACGGVLRINTQSILQISRGIALCIRGELMAQRPDGFYPWAHFCGSVRAERSEPVWPG